MKNKYISTGLMSLIFSVSLHSRSRPNIIFIAMDDENYRYTKYNDGTEELYDLKKDPMEWTNLIRLNDKEANKVKPKLEKWMPIFSAPNLARNSEIDSDKETEGKGSIKEFDKIRPLNELK